MTLPKNIYLYVKRSVIKQKISQACHSEARRAEGISCCVLQICTKLLSIDNLKSYMLIGTVETEGLVPEIPTSLCSSE